MKKLYYLFCIVCVLTICLPTKADVNIRFWDNGILVHTATEEQGAPQQAPEYYYDGTPTSCTGYTFVGWRRNTPLLDEEIFGNDADAGVLSLLAVGSEDIDLYAVYEKDVICYTKITDVNDLVADSTYLIVGFDGTNYHAMRGDDNAKVNAAENSPKLSGLFSDDVTLCANNKIYPTNKNVIWKLGGTSGNWTWKNQGATSNYLQIDLAITAFLWVVAGWVDYVRDMIKSSSPIPTMNIGIESNGAVTMNKTSFTGLLTNSADARLSFAHSVVASTDYFGTAQSDIFIVSDVKNSSENLSGSQISKGTIFLFKATKEYRYKSKCDKYSVYFQACGDNTCGDAVYVTTDPLTDADPTTTECTELTQYGGVNPNSVSPTVCTERWTFKGWAEKPQDKTTTDPRDSYVGNSYVLKYQDANLYAVYRHKTHGVEDYWTSYPNCSEYTVTFDPGNGQVSPTSITESPIDNGITLPTASFSACSGWNFAGWATSACESADAAPVGLKNAGATYYPAAGGEEFYAVYTNSTRWTSYPVCDKASVALNAGTGTVDGNTTKVLTEANIGDGVTLIGANSGCSIAWAFAGWSHTIVTTTTTAPSVYSSGTTYHPIQANDQLYAVYVRGTAPNQVWTTSPSCSAYNVILHACGDNTCDYSSVNGESVYTLNEGAIGLGVVFPTAETSCDSRWTFSGWNAGSPIEHKYTLPTGLYATDASYIPTQDNETFYAVYKHKDRDYWTSNPDCEKYTVHLHACEGEFLGGASVLDKTEENAGDGIALPSVDPLCDARGWQFRGWIEGGDLATTQNISGLTIYPAGWQYTPIRNNIHLYAVYSVSSYQQVTSYDELNTTDEYVIAFYRNYGNAYHFENFALSNQAHAKHTTCLNLIPIEAYSDAEGNKYVAEPENTCKWRLAGNSTDGWSFHSVANTSQYVRSWETSANLTTSNSNNRTAFTINLEQHCMERKTYSADYRYWHFMNDNLTTFYAYQDESPDRCYLYRPTGTVYSSWPHCEAYTVYFDGCDGRSDEVYKRELDAGKGVIVPNVSQECSNWSFAGWATAPYEEKTGTLTRDLYPANTTFVPNKNNMTLYAVYYQTENEFELTDGINDMYAGVNYMIVYNGAEAMSNTLYNTTNRWGVNVNTDFTLSGDVITSSTSDTHWRLLGYEGNYIWYNAVAIAENKYLDLTFTYNGYYYASLQETAIDNFNISFISSDGGYFLIRSNISQTTLRRPSDGAYFDCYSYASSSNTKIKLYRQKADYWSYPCSKQAEAVKWGDGTVSIESLSIDGAPTSGSAVISSITTGEDNTYVVTHTAKPGRRMRVAWDGNYYSLTVPYIVTPTYTPEVENLPKYDLVLLPNTSFTVEKDTWLHSVSVYDDATLIIADGNTLTVDTLYLRSEGPNKQPNVVFGGTSAQIVINSGIIYYDYRIDYYNFYPFGLPYNAAANEVTYAGLVANTTVPELYNNYFVQYYDGPRRAADANEGNPAQRTYWTNLEDPTSTLNAGEGYGIGIADNTIGNHNKRTLRFKLTPGVDWNNFETSTDRAITIKPSKVNDVTLKQHSGWNFVTNPYFHTYYPGNADAGSGLLTGRFDWIDGKWQIVQDGTQTVPYLTFYDVESDDYYQTTAATGNIPPFTTAFVQVEDYDQLLFSNPIQAGNAAPVRKATPEPRIIRTGIILYEKQASAKEHETPSFDETGLVISNRYTNEYEVGADLIKWSASSLLHVYTFNQTHQLAFNALDEQSAAQPIPVGVSVPKAGSYTFLFDERQYDADALEALYLTDYQQNKTVNALPA